ncbi:MAG: SLC13 family permease, partial [Gammaproteobacteria bacterium]|nr:SLC13 family permease [Gammaproteobacteria bacterium]
MGPSVFPEIPNLHAGVTLLTTLIALALFSREKLPLETSSLIVLAALAIFFEVVPFGSGGETFSAISLFSGFGHEALIAVIGLMVCGHGLVVTGALQPVGRMIARLWQTSPLLSLLLTLLFGAVGSAFINNTPVVVLLIPLLINVASRNGSSAAPWLMPMNFSTLLGGSCTSIGTSTNLLVISVAADLGLRRLGMFDFAVPAMMAGAMGMVYLWLIAPRILGRGKLTEQSAERRMFYYELHFAEDSSSIGSTVGELQSKAGELLEIVRIKRSSAGENRSASAPLPDLIIEPGDRLTGR